MAGGRSGVRYTPGRVWVGGVVWQWQGITVWQSRHRAMVGSSKGESPHRRGRVQSPGPDLSRQTRGARLEPGEPGDTVSSARRASSPSVPPGAPRRSLEYVSDTPQREAEDVPGDLWSSPNQATHVYPNTGRPVLRVYTGGKWRRATVTSKHVYPDGRVSVSCQITLPDAQGLPGTYHRTWWWSADRMRIIWDGRSE